MCLVTPVKDRIKITMTGRFSLIHQYFPVRGHSFLPCDRDFATVKRVIRRYDRIYIPLQYNNIIKGAKKTQPTFDIISVENQDIIDFKSWWPNEFNKTTKSIGTKESFKVSQYKHLVYKQEQRGYIQARPNIDGLLSETFKRYKGKGNV